MNLERRLADEEQATEQQDEIPTGELMPNQRKQRRRKSHHPRDRQQQQHA
jgi:hypothetical protein